MDIRGLETLLWIARLGGVSAAAKHLNVTQPAITRRVQALEQALGAEVLRRQGRTVALTPAGHNCVVLAEKMMAELAALRVSAGGASAIAGPLRIGVGEVIALTWIDRLLARIAEAYPRLSPELDVDLSGRLLGKLARGSIDLALLPGPVAMRSMSVVDLGSCALRWMAHPRIAPPGPILTPLDLVDTPIVTLPAESDLHAAMVEWFDHSGTRPRQVSCCTSLSVLISLVQKGVGVSILPEEMLKPAIEAGGLIVIPEQPRLPLAKYSAAYIPRNDLPILPEIAQLARHEATRTTWWHG